jgi:hypothetical protein
MISRSGIKDKPSVYNSETEQLPIIPFIDVTILKRIINHLGYVMLRCSKEDKTHPMVSVWQFIAEHRLIMARHLGRCLYDFEVVHHINGIKDDNRLENLQLLTDSEHSRHHHPSIESIVKNPRCSKCGSDKTRIQIKHDGRIRKQWHYIEDGQIACVNCSAKTYRSRSSERIREYHRRYKQENPQYQKQASLRRKIFALFKRQRIWNNPTRSKPTISKPARSREGRNQQARDRYWRNAEQRRQYIKEWQKNKEGFTETLRQYRNKNRDRIRQYHKQWVENNKEKNREYKLQYYYKKKAELQNRSATL